LEYALLRRADYLETPEDGLLEVARVLFFYELAGLF